MTINTFRSDFFMTRDYQVASTSTGLIEEGCALNQVLDGTNFNATLSVGASNNEVFLGFALNERRNPISVPIVDTLVVAQVGAAYQVTLSRVPLSTPGVLLGATPATATALTKAALTGDGTKYTLNGQVIAVDAANNAATLIVTYNYSPTLVDIYDAGGWNAPGSYNSLNEAVNSTGVVMQGTVYTDKYLPSDNWASWNSSSVVKAGANGILTMAAGATGATVKCEIVHIPDSTVPFLGVRFGGF